MRVLHVNNIAGVASTISDELRRRGYVSDVLVFEESTYGFPYDYIVTGSKFAKLIKTVFKGFKYNIVHWHYPRQRKTIKLYSKLKPIIKHYHGTDLRNRFETDLCIVSTPDLLEYAPRAIYLPNPVNTENLKPLYKANNLKPVICWYCSAITVFEAIRKAEKSLGNKYAFIKLKGYKHYEALQLIAKSDLFIDIRLNGWYGLASIEAMAFGKPVIGNIKEEFRRRYNPPVVQYDSYGDLVSTINEVLSDENLRFSCAISSRNYVEKEHNVKIIADRLIKIYSEHHI